MIESILDDPASHLLAICLITTRVVSFIVLLPLFGAGTVPIRFRVLFGAMVSAVILPATAGQVELPPTVPMFAVCIIQEAILGLALGTGVQLIFGGLDVAGKLMGELSGLSIVRSYDGTAASSEAPQAFLRGFAVCLFLVFGGHRMLIEGILNSFQNLPPGETHFATAATELLTSILGQSFQFGIRVAAPAILAMLIASLTVGFVTRSVPQMASLTMGMGLNMLLLFGVLLFSLGTIGWVFQDFVEQMMAELFAVLV